MRLDDTEEYKAGGGAQPWEGCAGVRSAVEGGGELHTPGKGADGEASGSGGRSGNGDQRLTIY